MLEYDPMLHVSHYAWHNSPIHYLSGSGYSSEFKYTLTQ